MPSQPEAQGDILKEFKKGTILSSLDTGIPGIVAELDPSKLGVDARE